MLRTIQLRIRIWYIDTLCGIFIFRDRIDFTIEFPGNKYLMTCMCYVNMSNLAQDMLPYSNDEHKIHASTIL